MRNENGFGSVICLDKSGKYKRTQIKKEPHRINNDGVLFI